MRNGGIGRGWYEDVIRDSRIENEPQLQDLAINLLRENLDFIWNKYRENKK